MTEDLRWKPSSWLTVIAAAALLLVACLSLAYRWTLPTDGWTINDEVQDVNAPLRQNVLGLPSGLQPGDDVRQVQGIATISNGFTASIDPAAYTRLWQPGATVRYVVQRNGTEITIPVQLGNWTLRDLTSLASVQVLVELAYSIIALAIGIFVFVRRPTYASAQVLLFIGAVRLTQDIILVLPYGVADLLVPTAIRPLALLGYYSWGILLFPSIFLFSLVFPQSKWPIRRYPLPTLLVLYLVVLLLMLVTGFGSAESALFGYGGVAVFGLFSVISVIHSVITTRHDPIMRPQVLWVGMGVAALAGMQAFQNLWGFIFPNSAGFGTIWLDALYSLSQLVLPITLAIAILRYRLFDIDVIIRRTLTYSVLSAMLAAIYFGLVVTLQNVLRAVTGSDSQLAIVASTLAIAALFLPLRSRVQAFIDRRFFRRKYNAEQAVARFNAEMRAAVDMDDIATKLMDAVDGTLQPGKIVLWLPGKGRTNEHIEKK